MNERLKSEGSTEDASTDTKAEATDKACIEDRCDPTPASTHCHESVIHMQSVARAHEDIYLLHADAALPCMSIRVVEDSPTVPLHRLHATRDTIIG